MRSHTNDTPFRCEICGKSFSRKEHFTNHILWHTGKHESEYRMVTLSTLAILFSTGETPHRCDFCAKTFTRKEHLLNHVRQHTGESPHRCTYCLKTFTRKVITLSWSKLGLDIQMILIVSCAGTSCQSCAAAYR